MEKEPFIELTKGVYRLTLLFPKKEPLRYKMRELADEILANLILILRGNFHKSGNLVEEVERNLEVLDVYFEVAKDQNWVSPDEIFQIQKEYSNIKEEIEKVKKEEEKNPQPKIEENPEKEKVAEGNDINERQKKILEICGKKERLRSDN